MDELHRTTAAGTRFQVAGALPPEVDGDTSEAGREQFELHPRMRNLMNTPGDLTQRADLERVCDPNPQILVD